RSSRTGSRMRKWTRSAACPSRPRGRRGRDWRRRRAWRRVCVSWTGSFEWVAGSVRDGSVGGGPAGQGRARDTDRERQPEEGERLAVAVEVERIVDAALQDVIDDEVERPQARQLVALHAARPPVPEERGDAFDGDLLADQREVGLVVGDHAHVQAVALVAGAAMRDAV